MTPARREKMEAFEELPLGTEHAFSPSGRWLAFRPLLHPVVLEIRPVEGGEPVQLELSEWPLRFVWISDEELVYSIFWAGNTLHLFSLEERRSRPLLEIDAPQFGPNELGGGSSWAPTSAPGCFSYMGESGGREGFFTIDARRGRIERRPGFDLAFQELDVYPPFGHSWSPDDRRVVAAAWPRDYLEDGVQATQTNSQWTPALDDPTIQNFIAIKRDGTRVTQRELSQEARWKKPFRLFLLDETDAYQELLGTSHGHQPQWSPDGTLLAYRRYEEEGVGLYLMQTGTWAGSRLGSVSLGQREVVHPEGVLYCHLEAEHQADYLRRVAASRWQRIRFPA